MPGWDVTTRRLRGRARAGQGAAVAEAQPAPHQRAASDNSKSPFAVNKYLARARRRRASRTGRAGSRTRSGRATRSAPAPRTPSACRIARADPDTISYLKMQTRAAAGRAEGDVRERHRRVRESRSNTLPPYKLGGAGEPDGQQSRVRASCCAALHGAARRPGDRRAGRLHAGRVRAAVRAERRTRSATMR